jgi:hypothetical protein
VTNVSQIQTSADVDRLARELAQLTGETEAEATAHALRDRLERERAARSSAAEPVEDFVKRIQDHAARLRARYDLPPVSKAEWDALWGDDA